MTKLVLKTVAITLVAILGACLITFGSLALLAPATVANFCDGLGMYKTSIHYYEKQYGKSDSIDDLAVLILKLDEERDSLKTETYLKAMIEHEDYAVHCANKDASNQTFSSSANEFYQSEYAVALVRNDKFSTALSVANDYVSDNGYTKFNPFSVIISELGLTLDDEKLNLIKTEISAYSTGEYASSVSADVLVIEQLLDNN